MFWVDGFACGSVLVGIGCGLLIVACGGLAIRWWVSLRSCVTC